MLLIARLLVDGFATNDLAFFWDEAQNVSAIRVNEDLEMPDFVLSNYEAKYCNRTTATGERNSSSSLRCQPDSKTEEKNFLHLCSPVLGCRMYLSSVVIRFGKLFFFSSTRS